MSLCFTKTQMGLRCTTTSRNEGENNGVKTDGNVNCTTNLEMLNHQENLRAKIRENEKLLYELTHLNRVPLTALEYEKAHAKAQSVFVKDMTHYSYKTLFLPQLHQSDNYQCEYTEGSTYIDVTWDPAKPCVAANLDLPITLNNDLKPRRVQMVLDGDDVRLVCPCPHFQDFKTPCPHHHCINKGCVGANDIHFRWLRR